MDGVVIGIDGGGTKTRVVAILADPKASASPVATADAGPCNIAIQPMAEALASVADGVGRLGIHPASVQAVCAAVAGYSFEERRGDLVNGLAALCPNAKISVLPDYVAAHLGGHAGGYGITAIAGTGAVAYGRDRAEADCRVGGYGYLIDDSGSGYGVGRRALAAVLTAADGSGAPTSLSNLLAAELGNVEQTYLIKGVYGGNIDRTVIASLARQVSHAAALGDDVSVGILRDTALAQARSVIAVASTLFEPYDDIPVTTYGSLWKSGQPIVNPFVDAIKAAYPGTHVEPAMFDAAVGAALYGRQYLAANHDDGHTT